MSFRTREYYKDDDWDKTGIDLAFWNGHEKSDLAIRLVIISMMIVDILTLIDQIIIQFTSLKILFLILIILLSILILPIRTNLTILHLEYKRIDIFTYKVLPFLRPIKLSEGSVYLVDFVSASISKKKFQFSPSYEIKLKFSKPDQIINVPFRKNLPYRIHHYVYYNLNRKCSAEIVTTMNALEKFYPYFELKRSARPLDFRYLTLLTYFFAYFIFTVILTVLVS